MTISGPDARGLLFVLSGPSGVGKDAVLEHLLAAGRALPRLLRCVTATTRPPRTGEVHGVDYLFVDEGEFERRVAAGLFLEHATFAGRRYGTPRDWVDGVLERGDDVLLKIEVQGALQVRAQAPDAVMVFLAPPSEDELERRLRGRDRDAEPADLARRLERARVELRQSGRYDYLVVNELIPVAADAVRSIVVAERCRVRRREAPAAR